MSGFDCKQMTTLSKLTSLRRLNLRRVPSLESLRYFAQVSVTTTLAGLNLHGSSSCSHPRSYTCMRSSIWILCGLKIASHWTMPQSRLTLAPAPSSAPHVLQLHRADRRGCGGAGFRVDHEGRRSNEWNRGRRGERHSNRATLTSRSSVSTLLPPTGCISTRSSIFPRCSSKMCLGLRTLSLSITSVPSLPSSRVSLTLMAGDRIGPSFQTSSAERTMNLRRGTEEVMAVSDSSFWLAVSRPATRLPPHVSPTHSRC